MAAKKNGSTQQLATQDPPGALMAQRPANLEAAFTEEEWSALSPAEQREALDFFREESAKTTDGVQVEFPRVKYPTSGANFWEVPDLTAEGGLTPAKTIEGIVVYKQPVRAYWPLGDEVGNNPPACSSLDGIVPVGGKGPTGATVCHQCPYAQWDSGKEGRGQACKARLNVFLLMGDEEIPTLLSLPPSQLKTFGSFAVQLRKAKVPGGFLGVQTVFSLTDQKSGTGIAFKGVGLRIGRPLKYAEMKRASDLRAMFEAQMAKRGVRIDEVSTDDDSPGREGQVIDAEPVLIGDAVLKPDKKAGF